MRPFLDGLRAPGYDVDASLRLCAIDPLALDRPEGGVSHGVMMRVWNAAAESGGDPDLGIHVAEAVPIPSFEMHTYAFLSSASLREAFRRAARYQRLIHESTALLTSEKPRR